MAFPTLEDFAISTSSYWVTHPLITRFSFLRSYERRPVIWAMAWKNASMMFYSAALVQLQLSVPISLNIQVFAVMLPTHISVISQPSIGHFDCLSSLMKRKPSTGRMGMQLQTVER